MKNRNKAFYVILAVVLITGLIFSLYAFSKIRSIHELRAAVEKSAAERALSIEKNPDLRGAGNPLQGVTIPRKIWATEFIEIAYNTSRKYGISHLAFEQKPPESSRRQTQGNGKPSFQSYPVKIAFHAGYREMAEFIRELQGLDRLVTIDNLRVKNEKTYLAVEMTVSTYAMEGK